MRLDVYLKLSRLIPKRTLAKEYAKQGLIELNGNTAKAATVVSAGDELIINRKTSVTTVRILEVPKKKQVSKKDASSLYELLAQRKLDLLED